MNGPFTARLTPLLGLGLALALAACNGPDTPAAIPAPTPAAETADPLPSAEARTVSYDLRVERRTAEGVVGEQGAPASRAVRYAALIDGRGTTARIDLPGEAFPDGRARVLLQGAAFPAPRVLFAATRQADAALTRALGQSLPEGLRAQTKEGGSADPTGTTPAGALGRKNVGNLVGELEAAGFRREGQDAAGRLLLGRLDKAGPAPTRVTLAYDDARQAVTRLDTEQTLDGVVMKSTTEVRYKKLPKVDVPVPVEAIVRSEIVRTGAARLPVPAKPRETKFLPADQPTKLAPGEFVAFKYTGPRGSYDPNRTVTESVVKYENILVNAATPADFKENR